MTVKHLSLVVFFSVFILVTSYASTISTISLKGSWVVKLDRNEIGEKENWPAKKIEDGLPVTLPGSLTTNFIGDDISLSTPWMGFTGRGTFISDPKYAPYRQENSIKIPFWLQPLKYFKGKAFYQREITIPSQWANKVLELYLERCHWGSTVWIDGKKIGGNESLATPHTYQLGNISTGKHLLTICIDNNYLVRVGPDAHSVTDHTQTNWNGIIGELELRAFASVRVLSQQIYPQNNGQLKIKFKLSNKNSKAVATEIKFQVIDKQNNKNVANTRKKIKIASGITTDSIEFSINGQPKLWSEFSPNLYTSIVSLGNVSINNTFGFREIKTDGHTILVNNIPTFMRGNLDCAAFPLTGYPSTNVEEWRRIFNVYKAYGLNHVRFHSWCPPEAAFQAADEEGMYLQPECDVWRGTCPFPNVKPVEPFLFEEAQRICNQYGNHPSFVLFAHGNEPWELDRKMLTEKWVPQMKQFDKRHLVTAAAHYPIDNGNDFQLPATVEGFQLRYFYNFNASPSFDYEKQINQTAAPSIAHEPGEWCVFPNLKEIDKYTGVLKAKNFEIVRDFMTTNHLIEQADDFLMASGKFQTLIYKEETEAFLRTRGLAGFQMLGLNDFPGQGTALVGVVDVFWDSKPYVSPAEYKRFSGSVVPLALFKKRVWSNHETFSAEIRIAQYSGKDLKNTATKWKCCNSSGEVIASGVFTHSSIPVGNAMQLGNITVPLKTINKADKLTLSVSIENTDYQNEWSIWVYPAEQENSFSNKVLICRSYEEALTELAKGKLVLLETALNQVTGNTFGTFKPIFWNKNWFPGQKEHTLGLLIQNTHPALSNFPSDYYANWQWADLMNNSKPMVLDSLPANVRPIVQPIDDWNTCRRLGLVFEAKMGKGKLLVTSIDFSNNLDNRLTARQLKNSLLQYMNSTAFQPNIELTEKQLLSIFKTNDNAIIVTAKTTSITQPNAANWLIDNKPETVWRTNAKDKYPYSIQLELSKKAKIDGINFLPSESTTDGWVKDVEILLSNDGITWNLISKTALTNNQEWKKVNFNTIETKFIQIKLVSAHVQNIQQASFAEIQPSIVK